MRPSILSVTRCVSVVQWAIAASFVLAAVALASPAVAEDALSGGLDSCSAEYAIGPEDVLDVAVWNNTEITRTVAVRPDGKISLPLLNDVQASGFTPMQLREALVTALTGYIATPN